MIQTISPPAAFIAARDLPAAQERPRVIARDNVALAGPFASCAEVAAWVERRTPAIAILDAVLSDGPTDQLADALRRRGVLVLSREEVACTVFEVLRS